MPLGALYPSKSGLMNKHIVKHIGVLYEASSYPFNSVQTIVALPV